VFAIYRSTNIPDVQKTLKIWRNEAKKKEWNFYLCRFWKLQWRRWRLYERCFDAAIALNHSAQEYNPFSVIFEKDDGHKLLPCISGNKLSTSATQKKMFSLRRLDYGAYVDYLKSFSGRMEAINYFLRNSYVG